MAIKNSIQLNLKDGTSLPAGSVLVNIVRFPTPTQNEDADGNWDGTWNRVVVFDLKPFVSEAAIDADTQTPVMGELELVPSSWVRPTTEEEMLTLTPVVAETWLKDWVASLTPGNNPTIINPFINE